MGEYTLIHTRMFVFANFNPGIVANGKWRSSREFEMVAGFQNHINRFVSSRRNFEAGAQ